MGEVESEEKKVDDRGNGIGRETHAGKWKWERYIVKTVCGVIKRTPTKR